MTTSDEYPKLTTEEPNPPGSNPFVYDSVHAGVTLGANLTVMYSKEADGSIGYVILVDRKSGKKCRVDLLPQCRLCGRCAELVMGGYCSQDCHDYDNVPSPAPQCQCPTLALLGTGHLPGCVEKKS